MNIKRVVWKFGNDGKKHRYISYICDICGVNFAYQIDSHFAYHVDASDREKWRYDHEKEYENHLRNVKYCSDVCRKAGAAKKKQEARHRQQQATKNKKAHEEWKLEQENHEYGRKTVELTRTQQLNKELQKQIDLVKQQNAQLMEELAYGKKS